MTSTPAATTGPASRSVVLVAGEGLSRYGFADGHPFGPDRQEAFLREMRRSPAYSKVRVAEPRMAERTELESFHHREYVDLGPLLLGVAAALMLVYLLSSTTWAFRLP